MSKKYIMNIQYISGFFDADGSVTLSARKKGEFKSPQLSFSNTEYKLLKEIEKFLLQNYNIKGYISTKKQIKENHAIAYDLKYTGSYAKILSKILKLNHSKKLHRTNCINKYYNVVTKRNGKYNNNELSKKLAFERLFFCSIFQ